MDGGGGGGYVSSIQYYEYSESSSLWRKKAASYLMTRYVLYQNHNSLFLMGILKFYFPFVS